MRILLIFLVLVVAGLFVFERLNKPKKQTLSKDSFAALHEKAKWRERRIIQNNDGGEVRVSGVPIRSKEDFLAIRATPLIGSQVDTIVYDTTAGSFGSFSHNTKAGEPFLITEGRYRYNAIPEFLSKGTDPLKMMIEFARANDQEIIWAMRMNDTHDDANPLLLPEFKKKHPELLVSSDKTPLLHGKRTSVDYGQEEIRKKAFSFVEEVAKGYDVDGVELDFFRHPVFFKSAASGGKATDEDREKMSDLIHKIREMIRAEGKKRGKPILLSIRIPDSLEYCREIGLDVEKWLKEGWIDFVSMTGYFRLNPWSYSVELGKRFDLPVYPCLSESRITQATDPLSKRSTPEVYRARAANAWQAGAKGIYVFNSFNGNSPWWHEIGNPKALPGLNKRYFATVRTGDPGKFLSGGASFSRLTNVSPDNPRILSAGEAFRFSIDTAEDFQAASAQGKSARVLLRLNIRPIPKPETIQLTLNDTPLSDGRVDNGWITFSVKPDLLRAGSNEIAVGIASRQATSTLHSTYPGKVRRARIRIQEMEITPDPTQSQLHLQIKVEKNGTAAPEHLSIRPAKGDPAPGGFKRVGSYFYPPNWQSPGYPFEKGKNEIAVSIPVGLSKAGLFKLQVIILGRSGEKSVRDDRFFIFRITEAGAIEFPEVLYDAQIDVSYRSQP
ncbi:MAG: glycosyl hydrolase family 18 protein [Chthoniobacterales bacterium]